MGLSAGHIPIEISLVRRRGFAAGFLSSSVVSSSSIGDLADMFDPSVFDIRMVLAVLAAVGLIAYGIFRLFVRK